MPSVKTDLLEIHYLEFGPQDGWPVILSHGFPYSPHVYDKIAKLLADSGAHVIVPHLRGYGPTRFLSAETIRSGQQAALAQDLVSLLDALNLPKAILAGFDWGGLASCTASALFPERVSGLVCSGGYDAIDVEAGERAQEPGLERTMWYQHLFQHDRGKQCLQQHRRKLCNLLWREWSPNWDIPMDLFESAADGFNNPDFVNVVTSHYRFAFGNGGEDPRYVSLEKQLAAKPKIRVPAITVDGIEDPLKPNGTEAQTQGMFLQRHEHWKLQIGHGFPMEAPQDFLNAVLAVRKWVEFDS